MQLHDELLTTLVMYIGRLAAAGQLPLLRQIGMSPQQIDRVRRLSLAEMNKLSTLGGHFMDIRVDAEGQHRICKAWVDCSGEADPKLRLLEVHAATGFPVRAIWPVVNAWEGRGELPIADGDHGRWLDLLKQTQAKPALRKQAGHSAASAQSVQPPPARGFHCFHHPPLKVNPR